MERHIYLIGFMGTGKSTVSAMLSKKTGVEELDTDAEIVKEAGMPIAEMFEKYGEQYFRDAETDMLKKLSQSEPRIISCGGGMVLRPENVELMKKSGTTVLLTATPETVFARVRHGKGRPILNGHMNVEYIAELMEKRRGAYEAACDRMVSTDGKGPSEIADEILSQI